LVPLGPDHLKGQRAEQTLPFLEIDAEERVHRVLPTACIVQVLVEGHLPMVTHF
jgi:hypothetical protein